MSTRAGVAFAIFLCVAACTHKPDVSSSIENATQASEPLVIFRARATALKPSECLEVGRETWCKATKER
jgi:hypothetical protein